MDKLIENLGYLDYRDLISVNRYVLETKRSKDYHNQTRAKVLSYALKKFNHRQREKYEAIVKQALRENQKVPEEERQDEDELRLRKVLEID